MEDQRAEEIWWKNEIRSGRDPSKRSDCPVFESGGFPKFNPDCFQPAPKKELSDVLVEETAKHFGIKSEEDKCNLKIMFDAYAQFKMRESFMKAISELGK